MNADVRYRLMMVQARFLRALLGRAEVPPGFDTSQVTAAAAVLLARRRRAAVTRGGPPADPLRTQLEGRLELIERALVTYTALARLLERRRWRSILREGPELLRSAQAQETLLAEAVERVERRAHQEQWPKSHPVRVKVRQLHEQQARLEALANRHLIEAISVDGAGASLTEALARLELLVLSL